MARDGAMNARRLINPAMAAADNAMARVLSGARLWNHYTARRDPQPIPRDDMVRLARDIHEGGRELERQGRLILEHLGERVR